MGTVYATLSTAMNILGALLSPVHGGGETCGRAHTLLKVSASRAGCYALHATVKMMTDIISANGVEMRCRLTVDRLKARDR